MPATMFLKIDPEIKGDSSVQGYEGQIEVLHFQFGVTQQGGFSFAKGGARVMAQLEDMSFVFRTCSASPKLMQYCANGKHLTKATLSCIKAGEKPVKYLQITLTDVVVSSFRTGGGGDADVTQDSMSLNFAQIDKEFFATDNKGVATSAGKGNWNQQTGMST